MVRLQPYNYERFVQADHLEFSFGGGEANVAVSLANYGLDAVYVTKLPAHAIGQAAVNSLRRYGVDTSMIVRGGDRIGIYYNEKGASQRGSVCIYDRAHSAIQESTPSDFDWDVIFKGADWFHFTGITPALGPNMVDACRDACKAAKARGTEILICDTAGRLHNKKNLMAELNKISRVIDRELGEASKEVLLVLDAATGQNALSQAKLFSEAAEISGIILTKLDGTAKGGVVVPISREQRIPVKFVGVGEKKEDLQEFNPYDFAKALFTNEDEDEAADEENN